MCNRRSAEIFACSSDSSSALQVDFNLFDLSISIRVRVCELKNPFSGPIVVEEMLKSFARGMDNREIPLEVCERGALDSKDGESFRIA